MLGKIKKLWLCNHFINTMRSERGDPGTLSIIAISMVAAGAGMEIASMLNQPKAPEAPAPPTPPALPTLQATGATGEKVIPEVPSMDTASVAAGSELTKQRRTLLASGGATQLTGIGGAPLLSGDVSSKTLLGGS